MTSGESYIDRSPKVSAIIPVYNGAGFVGRAIESALAQTYPLTDIMVVDDGSSDNSAEVASRYPAPVRVLRQPNGGPAAARNHGSRECKGDWLAFLDADDRWFPNKTERQISVINDDTVSAVNSFAVPWRRGPAKPVTFERLWQRNCVGTSTMMVRRTIFDQVGGFDEDRGLISTEDYNLWLRIVAAGGKIVTLPEHLCAYEPAPNNLSSQIERFLRAELLNIQKISTAMHLSAKMVSDRRKYVYELYGRDFLNVNQEEQARAVFWEGLRQEPSVRLLAGAIVSILPRRLRKRPKWMRPRLTS